MEPLLPLQRLHLNVFEPRRRVFTLPSRCGQSRVAVGKPACRVKRGKSSKVALKQLQETKADETVEKMWLIECSNRLIGKTIPILFKTKHADRREVLIIAACL